MEICPGKSRWKSKFTDTAGAEAMREQFSLDAVVLTNILWTTVMNEHEQINKQRSHFLKNLFVSVLKWNSHYNSSVMCLSLDQKF